MGYGLGIFLLALGLILALAVQDSIGALDLTTIGWILSLAGVLVLVLTAVQLNSRRRAASTTTRVTHSDGSQTVRRTDEDPPPAV
jgi:uncharacterized protein YacL